MVDIHRDASELATPRIIDDPVEISEPITHSHFDTTPEVCWFELGMNDFPPETILSAKRLYFEVNLKVRVIVSGAVVVF